MTQEADAGLQYATCESRRALAHVNVKSREDEYADSQVEREHLLVVPAARLRRLFAGPEVKQ